MPPKRTGWLRRHDNPEKSVFLNVPYDANFQRLFLGYVVGVHAFGMVPRTTLEIPGGASRLERILELIAQCRYSIHDLSRVELSRFRPRVPRFNMPFELGLAVAHAKLNREHIFFVFGENQERLSRSISDLAGTDPYIHRGTLVGLFAQLGNAFVRAERQPNIREMRAVYRELRNSVGNILKASGSPAVFSARPFQDISTLASALVARMIAS